MDPIAFALQIFTMLTAILSSIHCLISPNTSIYIINEFPDHIRTSFLARFIMFAVFTAIIQSIWTNLTVLLISGISYLVYFAPLATTQLYFSNYLPDGPGFQRSEDYYTKPRFREAQTIRGLYRRFEIYHQIYLHLFSYILVPIQALILQLFLFCTYVLFNHSHTLNTAATMQFAIWCVFAVGTWSALIQVSGYVYSSSMKTLRSWKSHDWGSPYENKIMSRFARSCKPLSIGYHTTFVIRRLTILKFFKAVIRGTFRTLLMTK